MPEDKKLPNRDDSALVPFSASRWNPEDLTEAVEEIEITPQEFLFLKAKRDSSGTPNEIPDWVNTTPDPLDSYQLAYYHNGEEGQLVQVTYGEFITLKRHLAVMRGHLPAPTAYPRFASDAGILFERGLRLLEEPASMASWSEGPT
jgi:hypothetical protein